MLSSADRFRSLRHLFIALAALAFGCGGTIVDGQGTAPHKPYVTVVSGMNCPVQASMGVGAGLTTETLPVIMA